VTRTGVTLHRLVQPTIVYVRSSRQVLDCQSEWTLDRHYSVDIITTLTLRGIADEHSRPFCTHSLAHHWCDCHPPVPTRLPMRCMIGLPQGMWGRGSHGRCARWATSIRHRRRRCGMWAEHARDVRSCTIS